ncbi:MAG: DUF445 family protein [Spirochaetaceae bacterium]|jgi:uncharacterized membrane protein YheB (UPF0754 family)|nr:DUF445 family protein [Spirochaetaceae bacterium]
MNPLLGWLLPPLVGALIGYITNAVAIKMLFRPLRAIVVFGIRLPFTPGILPKQRHKLADSIGAMVERELFTVEIIKARLRHPEVREYVRKSLVLYTEKILNIPLEQIIHVPAALTGKSPSSPGEDIQGFLTRLAQGFITSPAFDSVMDKLFSTLADTYGNRTIRDILGNSGELENMVEKIIREDIDFSNPVLEHAITRIVELAGPVLTDSLIQFLKKEDTHRDLETHGRIFLTKTILKLNVFQRLFISAGQYDRTLLERMPEIIDDLILELEHMIYDENTNRRIRAFLREKTRTFIFGREFSGEFVQKITKLILAYLDRPLEELIRQWTASDFSGLGQKVLSLIKQKEGLDIKIRAALDHFFENHRETSLAALFSVEEETKKKIDALVCHEILSMMDKQTEAFLNSINVKTLVSDRINSLDMIRVERIVLDVMIDQLKWINFFGAVLGALIGLFQSFLSWFIRGGV